MTRRHRPPTTFRSVLDNERGIALVFVAMLLVVILGLAALAVDLGMLYNARAEAQRVADASAMAGVSALIDSPGNEDLARARAADYALRNDVRNMGITIIPDEDVDVELWRDRVRVRVHRTTDRGTGLGNLFARGLGFNESNVSAVAAAEAAVAGGVNCILPFALVDRWWEVDPGRLATQDDEFDLGTDFYRSGAADPVNLGVGEQTGYGEMDRGRVLRIYPGSTSDAPQPGWFYPVALSSGANVYRNAIAGCTEDVDAVVMRDEEIDIEPGRMVGPTRQGFEDLINQDANAFWEAGCVKRVPGGDCVSSPRIRPMVLISPVEQPTSPGRQAVTMRDFVGVFVICHGVLPESYRTNPTDGPVQCNPGGGNNPDAGVWIRFVDYRGVNPLSPGDAPAGSLVRVIRLVE